MTWRITFWASLSPVKAHHQHAHISVLQRRGIYRICLPLPYCITNTWYKKTKRESPFFRPHTLTICASRFSLSLSLSRSLVCVCKVYVYMLRQYILPRFQVSANESFSCDSSCCLMTPLPLVIFRWIILSDQSAVLHHVLLRLTDPAVPLLHAVNINLKVARFLVSLIPEKVECERLEGNSR